MGLCQECADKASTLVVSNSKYLTVCDQSSVEKKGEMLTVKLI